jgi:hypothetical protein
MPSGYSRRLVTEFEFISLLEQVLPKILNAQVINSPGIGKSHPDFLCGLAR